MSRQLYLSLILTAAYASAQTQLDLRTQTKGVDFQSAPYTRPLKTSASLPATCTQNELLLLTTAPAGSNIYACIATNNWVPENGGASSTIAIQSSGVSVGAEGTANFVPGLGVTNAITDLGTKINIQQSIDTAVVLSKAAHQAGQDLLCRSASGSASAYSCFLSPALTAYATGMRINWIPDVAADGTGATLNIDLLGAAPVMEADGLTVASTADILPGRLYALWYDGAVFRLPANGGAGGGATPIGAPNLVMATDPAGASVDTASLRSLTGPDLPVTARIKGFHVIFAGSDVTPGAALYVTMPYACTATGYVLAADPAGTATINLWKAADGDALPTSANAISTSGFTLASGNRIHGADLTDLSTTAWAAYDTTAVILSSVSGAPAHVEFMMECKQ